MFGKQYANEFTDKTPTVHVLDSPDSPAKDVQQSGIRGSSRPHCPADLRMSIHPERSFGTDTTLLQVHVQYTSTTTFADLKQKVGEILSIPATHVSPSTV